MLNTDTEKYWSGTVKQLKRLAEKELIKGSDVGVYYSNLISVSNMYELHREDNPKTLFFIHLDNLAKEKLEKIKINVKKLSDEISKGGVAHEAFPALINALNTFTNETAISKVEKGKKVKLSKHQIIRIFEMLFDHYTAGEKLSKSFLLGNEFLRAAGYNPESSNEKDLKLRKQNFDEARKALKKAGISDRDLFFQLC